MLRSLIRNSPSVEELEQRNETIERLKNNLIDMSQQNVEISKTLARMLKFLIKYCKENKQKLMHEIAREDLEFLEANLQLVNIN